MTIRLRRSQGQEKAEFLTVRANRVLECSGMDRPQARIGAQGDGSREPINTRASGWTTRRTLII